MDRWDSCRAPQTEGEMLMSRSSASIGRPAYDASHLDRRTVLNLSEPTLFNVARRAKFGVRRLIRFLGAGAIRVLLFLTPKRKHVFIGAWPSDEGNAVEVARALLDRYAGSIVWADAPDQDRLRVLGLNPRRICRKSKNTLGAFWAYLTAEVTFFTHGLYWCPRPVARKTIVNLWHGDGPKATDGARVPSTYLVSGSSVFVQSRTTYFGVDGQNVLLTGLPRTEQLTHPATPHQLMALRINVDQPFVVWMPTFRQAAFGGQRGGFSDTSNVTADQDLAPAILPLIVGLLNLGIQVAVKPHLLDTITRTVPGLILVTDEYIQTAGTTLYNFLGASAGLITDYSSVWTDYLLLDRPIAFFVPDASAYLGGRGLVPPDTMNHLPGKILNDTLDFTRFGEEVLGITPNDGPRLREQAKEHFGIVTSEHPADTLLKELGKRAALSLIEG
jgi:CDP-glycerol glycerophosphotransferase